MKLNEFEKIAKMLAKEYKISIQDGDSWAANIKQKAVFYKKEDIYSLPIDHILALLLHEIGHIHYTTNTASPIKNKGLHHAVLNMVEDISIENIIGQDYPNAGEILESTKQEVLDNLLKILPTLRISEHERTILFAATRFEGRGYSSGTKQYEKLGEEISEMMEKERKLIMTRTETSKLLPLIDKIVALLISKIGEPTTEEENKMRETINNRGIIENVNQAYTKREIIERLQTAKGWQKGEEIDNEITFIDKIADQATMIGKKLRTILKRNNAMEFGGRYRTGKITARRFVRVRVMKDRKPFMRRIIKSNQSYAFAIASDVSGSMFAQKDYEQDSTDHACSYALSSMFMVGEALRYAGIPRSMTIFGDESNTIAPMGKLQIPFNQMSNKKALQAASGGGTDIANAMEHCIKELSKIKAERKIMIILTDGESDLHEMKNAHKKAIKKGIEPLGITLDTYGTNSMTEVFGKDKNRIIKNLKDKNLIGTAFIDILKESIKKSPQT